MKENTIKAKEEYEKYLKKIKFEIGISYPCDYEIPILFSKEKEKATSFIFDFYCGVHEVSPVLICNIGNQYVMFGSSDFILDEMTKSVIKYDLSTIETGCLYDIKLLKDFIKEIK